MEKVEDEHFLMNSMEEIMSPTNNIRKTKIICTLGPSVASEEMIIKLLDAGMGIARLNFSHGDHAYHKQMVDNLRSALKNRPDLHCPIMLDTKGPQITTGFLLNNDPIQLIKDQTLIISNIFIYIYIYIATDSTHLGTKEKIHISYKNLARQVNIGDKILIADGGLALEVLERMPLKAKVLNDFLLGEKKNVNLPHIDVDLPILTEKDQKDILEFGLNNGIPGIYMCRN